MKRYIYSLRDDSLLRIEEADPECGIDYCEDCVCCMHCFGGVPCPDNREGEHRWVVYEDDDDDAKRLYDSMLEYLE